MAFAQLERIPLILMAAWFLRSYLNSEKYAAWVRILCFPTVVFDLEDRRREEELVLFIHGVIFKLLL